MLPKRRQDERFKRMRLMGIVLIALALGFSCLSLFSQYLDLPETLISIKFTSFQREGFYMTSSIFASMGAFCLYATLKEKR